MDSRQMLGKMERALHIIESNKKAGVKNAYDFELYRTLAKLIEHTCACLTYLDLPNLENTITRAHSLTFIGKRQAYQQLEKAQENIESSIDRRNKVYNDLVETWEQTRLPKGMSTPDKEFFHEQDHARHFVFRTADMSYLIYDEQLLDMEGYLVDLEDYMGYYKKN